MANATVETTVKGEQRFKMSYEEFLNFGTLRQKQLSDTFLILAEIRGLSKAEAQSLRTVLLGRST